MWCDLVLLFLLLTCLFSKITMWEVVMLELANGTSRTVPVKDKAVLWCTNAVRWSYPTILDESRMGFMEEGCKMEYQSHRIELNALCFLQVGFYGCETKKENFSIYLYVKDERHLLVHVDLPETNVVAQAGDDIILPCKPCFPDVQLTLWYNHDEKVEPDSQFHGMEVGYHEHYGFYLGSVGPGNSGFYHCTAKYENKTEEKFFQVVVLIPENRIDPPSISVTPKQNVFKTGQHVTLECFILVPDGTIVSLHWSLPNSASQHTIFNYTKVEKTAVNQVVRGQTILKIENVSMLDAGEYRCSVTDLFENTNEARYQLQVSDKWFIHLSPEGPSTLELSGGEATWTIRIETNSPFLSIAWFTPKDGRIFNSMKYNVFTNQSVSQLTVRDLAMSDSGQYRLEVKINQVTKSFPVRLKFLGIPEVSIVHEPVYSVHESATFKCRVNSEPMITNVVVSFLPDCIELQNCSIEPTTLPAELKNTSLNTAELEIEYYVNETGLVTCKACNIFGCDVSNFTLVATDIPNGISLDLVEGSAVISETVVLRCAASKYFYSSPFYWMIDETTLRRSNGVIYNNETEYSYMSFLTMSNLKTVATKNITCKLRLQDGSRFHAISYLLAVKDVEYPQFLNTSTSLTIMEGEQVTLWCFVEGSPSPKLIWFKDGDEVSPVKNRLGFGNMNQTLHISYGTWEDSGEYRCVASNVLGQVETKFSLNVRSLRRIVLGIIAGVVSMILGVVIVLLYCRVRTERRRRKAFERAGLNNFCKGQIESINPDIAISQQAELLPYDPKWEFPREKLKLGKIIGSGAFGIVMIAEAVGIEEHKSSTTVAVKMVKKNSNCEVVRALASELKIMSHLGQHLNVVNLLGACTDNIQDRELLVIVEYCAHGNLNNFLQSHRKCFVNQINPENGQLQIDKDPSALADSMIGDDGYLVPKGNPYLFMKATKPKTQVYTIDLIRWGFQVANGMEYLASKKVMHGDLATRNILLSQGCIVKICDFGLSKDIYQAGNYCKKSNQPLPVKWMSIEAIRDGVFSTQSDIWGFGVVLWELFTLAQTPYPGIPFDESFLNKLVSGYRMDKPEYATEDMYKLMLDCWNYEPMSRPSFTECAARLGNMLDTGFKHQYLELAKKYEEINDENSSSYLNLLNSPAYENFCGSTTTQEKHEDFGTRYNKETDVVHLAINNLYDNLD